MAEDCLFLNVFVPQNAPKTPLPVVFWIHGGSLVVGSTEFYGPLEHLVKKSAEDGKPFVLVALNYRLGALGWASLPELGKGNLGLLDQILALRWVKENIGAFGGDPGRVSLFGQSSGGTSIFALLAAPAAKGLFSAALSLSGSPNISMGRQEKERLDRQLWLPRTACAHASDLAACLRKADAANLTAALPAAYSEWGWPMDVPTAAKGGLGWAPLVFVDGSVLPEPVESALAKGSAKGVALLFANTQCEDGADKLPFGRRAPSGAGLEWLQKQLAPFPGQPTTKGAVAAAYQGLAEGFAERESIASYAVAALAADTGASCGTMALAEVASTQGDVFLGTLVQGAERPLVSQGCGGTGTTLPFHNFDFKAVLASAKAGSAGRWDPGEWCPYEAGEGDRALAQLLWGHWLSFLTTGKPLPSWRPLSEKQSHFVLGSKGGAREGWKRGLCGKLSSELGIGRSYWWIN